MKHICICGGGSLGHVCAAMFSNNGFCVNLLTGHPDKWNHAIIVDACDGKTISAKLNIVTDRPEEVIPFSDVILLCLPGFLIEDTLLQIKPFLREDTPVGSIVSSTGFFFFAHQVLGSTFPLFGFQRVPYIARVSNYGSKALLLGYKPAVNVAIEFSSNPEALRSSLELMTATPTRLLSNFYEAALTNSNPILHTGRLYSIWHDVKPTASQTLFYADWTDDASQTIIDMDVEFMNLLKKLGIENGSIVPLLEYYESTDSHSLTQKIRSIEAFKPILAPMILTPEGWMPDFSGRYFTEDFPFGLRFIKELAQENGVATPVIDKVYAWGMSKLNLQ